LAAWDARLDRCIEVRGRRPFIIEGVFLLEALNEVERAPDFLIFVEEESVVSTRGRVEPDLIDDREFSLTNQVMNYLARCVPIDRADFKLRGY
jgi:hypothetical protein